jgi:hypothetical protein
MALIDSKQAIGAVSELLTTQLSNNTSVATVDVGRPETAAASDGNKFNLFLYQIDIDNHLRNQSLDQGQPSPLWLVLHYLITAFDGDRDSDSSSAHRLLGEGMLALQELNFLKPSVLALTDNPESLKITFDSSEAELISKLMQGSDEKYRISAAFQIRPIMIAPSVPPSYSIPVKTVGPPGAEGVVVVPSLGPRLESVTPQKFIAGTELTIAGQDVNGSISKVIIGTESFPITDPTEGSIKTTVPLATTLSAGNHPLYLLKLLPGGMQMKSDCLGVQLLPEVATATPGVPGALVVVAGGLHGDLTINGSLLGGVDDSIFVAFYRNGIVDLMLEATGTVAQTSLIVTVLEDQALPADNYFIIVRVNGAQATNTPEVNWS